MRILRNLMFLVAVFASISQAAHAQAPRPEYRLCQPITDLVAQHRCLMKVAIQRADHVRVGQLMSTPYVNKDYNDESSKTKNPWFIFATESLKSDSELLAVFKSLIAGGGKINLVKRFDDSASGSWMEVPLINVMANRYASGGAIDVASANTLFAYTIPKLDPSLNYESWSSGVRRPAIFWATKCGISPEIDGVHIEIIKLLRQRGFDISASDNLGRAAAHRAVEYSWPPANRTVTFSRCDKLFETLTQLGVNAMAEDKYGHSAIDYTVLFPQTRPQIPYNCTTDTARIIPHSRHSIAKKVAFASFFVERGYGRSTISGFGIPCTQSG